MANSVRSFCNPDTTPQPPPSGYVVVAAPAGGAATPTVAACGLPLVAETVAPGLALPESDCVPQPASSTAKIAEAATDLSIFGFQSQGRAGGSFVQNGSVRDQTQTAYRGASCVWWPHPNTLIVSMFRVRG
jgi:hypothetical protein